MAVVGDGVNDLPTIVVKSPEARRAELRRMRTIATSLLVVMTLIFIATRFAPPNWLWAPYLGAFAEAGMVGACADWFAVVALFRRPLGLPIPHTAIVPENKRRIGASLGRFVTNNFLSPRVAARAAALDRHRGPRGPGLADPRNAEAITAIVGRLAPHAIAALPPDAVEDWIGGVARAGPRRCRPPRSPRGRFPSSGRRARGRPFSIRASASSKPRSQATRRRSSSRCGASRRHGSQNGSTRSSRADCCRGWPERSRTCGGLTIRGGKRSRRG